MENWPLTQAIRATKPVSVTNPAHRIVHWRNGTSMVKNESEYLPSTIFQRWVLLLFVVFSDLNNFFLHFSQIVNRTPNLRIIITGANASREYVIVVRMYAAASLVHSRKHCYDRNDCYYHYNVDRTVQIEFHYMIIIRYNWIILLHILNYLLELLYYKL